MDCNVYAVTNFTKHNYILFRTFSRYFRVKFNTGSEMNFNLIRYL